MTDLEQLLALAQRLSPAERAQLARALGAPVGGAALPLLTAPAPPAPHSAAWLKAERGHAVLDPGEPEPDAAIPAGPEAIAGMWASRRR
jgi:hypothetical protein